MIEVTVHDGQEFFAARQDEQDLLNQTDLARAMETRLRPYFPLSFGDKPLIFAVEMDGMVVGVAECLREEPSGDLALSYVSVDAGYRKRGVAKAILARIVDYALEHGHPALRCSYFTPDGALYLGTVLRREASRLTITVDGKQP